MRIVCTAWAVYIGKKWSVVNNLTFNDYHHPYIIKYYINLCTNFCKRSVHLKNCELKCNDIKFFYLPVVFST